MRSGDFSNARRIKKGAKKRLHSVSTKADHLQGIAFTAAGLGLTAVLVEITMHVGLSVHRKWREKRNTPQP